MRSTSAIGRFVVRSGIPAVVAFAPVIANAAFFQLAENSPAAIGSANAGGAALADDASTVWFNPAGLTRLSGTQAIVGAHLIGPSLKFNKTSANLSPTLGGGSISGGNGGDAGEGVLLPNFYYAHRFNDRMVFGLGINVPFGLATDYEDNWVGRYHADRSEIETVNINPAFGYALSDSLSLGAGVNYQKLNAELTQAVDYGSLCALAATAPGGAVFAGCAAPGANDGRARIDAGDRAWGFNMGLLWQATTATRLGLAYRSKIKYDLVGTSIVTAPSALAAAAGTAAAGITSSTGLRANVTVPAILSLSAHQTLSPNLGLMADVTRVFWSKLPELRIDFDNNQADSVVTLGLKDVNRYAVGLEYKAAALTYRAGVALDKTPTPSAELRTPRLPDADRMWYSLGVGCKVSNQTSLDFAYSYVAVDDAPINKSAGTSTTGENFLRGSLVGEYEARIHILSAQLNMKF